MCGIVGLFLKDKSLEPQLGAMLSDMLISLSDRGPDSAGIAIYGAPSGDQAKITIQSPTPERDFRGLEAELAKSIEAPVTVTVKSTHAVVRAAADKIDEARDAIQACALRSGSWGRGTWWRSTRRSGCRKTWSIVSMSGTWPGRMASATRAWPRNWR